MTDKSSYFFVHMTNDSDIDIPCRILGSDDNYKKRAIPKQKNLNQELLVTDK